MNRALEKTENPYKAELAKFNIADSVIEKMKEEFGQLTVADVNDREGLKQVHDARIVVKNKRIEIEKTRKDLKEDSLKFGKMVDNEAKRLTALLEPIETYLSAEEDKIENEKKRIKEEREQKQQAVMHERTNLLIGYGLAFNGDKYSIADIAISLAEMKVWDDFTFNIFAEKAKVEFEKEKARKDQEELERKQAAEKLKQEQLDLAAKQKEIQEKQLALEATEKANKLAAEAAAKKLKEERDALQAEKLQQIEARNKQRASVLFSLGMALTVDKYAFHDIAITEAALKDSSDEDFQTTVEKTTKIIGAKKEELEKKRLTDLKIAEDAAVKKAADDKAAADKKAKEEAERLEQLKPDKEKIVAFANTLQALKLPELTTEAGKLLLETISKQHTAYSTWLNKQAESLK